MRKRIKLNNGDKQLETVINQMQRKLRKTTAFAVPPIPMSLYQSVLSKDNTLKYMNSIDGKLTNFCFYCAKVDKVKEVPFKLHIISAIEVTHTFEVVTGKTTVVKLDIPIKIGDRLSFTHIHPEVLEDVWIGCCLFPEKANFNYKQLVIDELDAEED